MKELILWVGPVHSGKSTKALLRAERYLRLGHDVVLIRPAVSVRPDHGDEPGMLRTKNGHRYPAIELDTATDIPSAVASADVVWLDEPMLFKDEEAVFDIICKVRKTAIVLVSALSATSELSVFGSSVARLLAVADNIFFCTSDCDSCGGIGRASRSVCVVPKQEQVLVGGATSYLAMCPDCWTNT